MGSYSLVDGPIEDGDDVILVYEVNIDYSNYNYYGGYTQFYTYVKFKNVYVQNGKLHYDSAVTPNYHLIAFNTPGSMHKVQGFATEEEARDYAM